MQKQLKIPKGYSAAILHTHTNFTDGMVSPNELVKVAAESGVTVLAITDHDTFLPICEAQIAGKKCVVEIICGEEIQTSLPRGLHIIGLYLKKPISHSKSVEWTIREIRRQGGIAVVVHPLIRLFGVIPAPTAAFQIWDLKKLVRTCGTDAIEICHPYLSQKDQKLLDEFYNEHQKKLGAKIGASDSHFGEKDMFEFLTIFPGRGASDLYKALKERTTRVLKGTSYNITFVDSLRQSKKALVDLGIKRYSRMIRRWFQFDLKNTEETI